MSGDLTPVLRDILKEAYADTSVWFNSYRVPMGDEMQMCVTVHSRRSPKHSVTVTAPPLVATALAYQKYQETRP